MNKNKKRGLSVHQVHRGSYFPLNPVSLGHSFDIKVLKNTRLKTLPILIYLSFFLFKYL